LLALPFVLLLGASAYQGTFWLSVFAWQVARRLGPHTALALLSLMVFLSPAVLHTVCVGTDYLANALFVLMAMWWLWEAAGSATGRHLETGSPGRTAQRRLIGFGIFLGIAVASRPNFLLVLPPLWAALLRAAGRRRAGVAMLSVIGTFLVLCLPFYLLAPEQFSPLHVASKLARFDRVLPHAALSLLIANVALACVLALRHSRNFITCVQACAWTLAIPVLAGVALQSAAAGKPSFAFASYGLFALPFGVLGYGLSPRGEPSCVR
jgi:hypothetical protein